RPEVRTHNQQKANLARMRLFGQQATEKADKLVAKARDEALSGRDASALIEDANRCRAEAQRYADWATELNEQIKTAGPDLDVELSRAIVAICDDVLAEGATLRQDFEAGLREFLGAWAPRLAAVQEVASEALAKRKDHAVKLIAAEQKLVAA